VKATLKKWLAGLAAAVGIFFVYRILRLRMVNAEARAEFLSRAQKANALENRLDMVTERLGTKNEIRRRLDRELRKTRREALGIVESTQDLSDKEVLERFRRVYKK